MDVEHEAIGKILAVLEPLEPSGQARVASYLVERFVGRAAAPPSRVATTTRGSRKRPRRSSSERSTSQDGGGPDIALLVNDFKALGNFDQLESGVLDNPDLLGRILVALGLYRRRYGEVDGMTSGDIAKFYGQLGVKLGTPNVSTTLSGRAKRFVITDAVRRKGAIMRYRLSHHGAKEASNYGIATE